jgi:hypothetical protein
MHVAQPEMSRRYSKDGTNALGTFPVNHWADLEILTASNIRLSTTAAKSHGVLIAIPGHNNNVSMVRAKF